MGIAIGYSFRIGSRNQYATLPKEVQDATLALSSTLNATKFGEKFRPTEKIDHLN